MKGKGNGPGGIFLRCDLVFKTNHNRFAAIKMKTVSKSMIRLSKSQCNVFLDRNKNRISVVVCLFSSK